MAIGEVDAISDIGYSEYAELSKVGQLQGREAKIIEGQMDLRNRLQEIYAKSAVFAQAGWNVAIAGMTKCTRYVEGASGELVINQDGFQLKGSVQFRDPDKKNETPPQNLPAQPKNDKPPERG